MCVLSSWASSSPSFSCPLFFPVPFLQLVATDGLIRKHAHVRTGRYHQVSCLTPHLQTPPFTSSPSPLPLLFSPPLLFLPPPLTFLTNTAPQRLLGLERICPQIHDAVLSSGEGRGANEESPWEIWSHWKTAGSVQTVLVLELKQQS